MVDTDGVKTQVYVNTFEEPCCATGPDVGQVEVGKVVGTPLVIVVGYEFLKASATAKLVNIATNFGAIVTFQLTGHIWWRLGLALAFANVTGALIGSRLAIRGGSPLVRRIFLLVVAALIAKLSYDWIYN